MSTVMKNSAGPTLPSPGMWPSESEQLRRDRWTAIGVVAFTLAMIALMVWLASLGGGVASEGIDYWPMMP